MHKNTHTMEIRHTIEGKMRLHLDFTRQHISIEGNK